jgi:hypothetical protein
MEFELRSEAFSPVFAGTYQLGGPIDNPWEPEIGNIVTLKSGEVSVSAKIITADERLYTGEIIGFENHDEYIYEDKKPNDAIQFNYNNIISCMR